MGLFSLQHCCNLPTKNTSTQGSTISTRKTARVLQETQKNDGLMSRIPSPLASPRVFKVLVDWNGRGDKWRTAKWKCSLVLRFCKFRTLLNWNDSLTKTSFIVPIKTCSRFHVYISIPKLFTGRTVELKIFASLFAAFYCLLFTAYHRCNFILMPVES